MSVKRAPGEHAGGKWRLSYKSALDRPAIIEVDVNYMFRVPLWDTVLCDSKNFAGDTATRFRLLDPHELAAGKLAALLARNASRDLFDARELLRAKAFDRALLRTAFVVYGGLNRVDWRTVCVDNATTTAADVKRQLSPMLRQDIRPSAGEVSRWTDELIEETRALLDIVLPLTEPELRFLERLNGEGVVEAPLLTTDLDLQQRIQAHPGLQWKALNVQKHLGA